MLYFQHILYRNICSSAVLGLITLLTILLFYVWNQNKTAERSHLILRVTTPHIGLYFIPAMIQGVLSMFKFSSSKVGKTCKNSMIMTLDSLYLVIDRKLFLDHHGSNEYNCLGFP